MSVERIYWDSDCPKVIERASKRVLSSAFQAVESRVRLPLSAPRLEPRWRALHTPVRRDEPTRKDG